MKNRTVNLDASAEILKLQGNLDILRLEQLDGGLQVVLALAGDPQAVALDCHGDLLELVAHRFAQRLGQLLAEPLAQLDHLLDAVAAHGFRGLKIEDLERQVALGGRPDVHLHRSRQRYHRNRIDHRRRRRDHAIS